jgi:hypothetical protein
MGMCHQKVMKIKPLMGSFTPFEAFVSGTVVIYIRAYNLATVRRL